MWEVLCWPPESSSEQHMQCSFQRCARVPTIVLMEMFLWSNKALVSKSCIDEQKNTAKVMFPFLAPRTSKGNRTVCLGSANHRTSAHLSVRHPVPLWAFPGKLHSVGLYCSFPSSISKAQRQYLVAGLPKLALRLGSLFIQSNTVTDGWVNLYTVCLRVHPAASPFHL